MIDRQEYVDCSLYASLTIYLQLSFIYISLSLTHSLSLYLPLSLSLSLSLSLFIKRKTHTMKKSVKITALNCPFFTPFFTPFSISGQIKKQIDRQMDRKIYNVKIERQISLILPFLPFSLVSRRQTERQKDIQTICRQRVRTQIQDRKVSIKFFFSKPLFLRDGRRQKER